MGDDVTTRFEVLGFDEKRLSSECKVIATDDPWLYLGQRMYVDLTVNADFGDMPEKELIGKIVEVERLQPCEFIGVNVSVVKEQS